MRKKWVIILLVLTLLATIYGCGSSSEERDSNNAIEITAEEENIKTEITETTDNEIYSDTTEVVDKTETINMENGVRDEKLEGRGNADVGRSEPEYVGIIGYVAIREGYLMDVAIEDLAWIVPTYEQDKQFWNETSNVEHKTEVLVKEQILEHQGYGRYSGYLLVERTDTKEQFYIDVKDFVTNPYWLNADTEEAVRIGDFIAEFKQLSDYYPVDKDGEKVELKDGTLVLATGTTGTYGGNGPDNDTNQIEVVVLSEDANTSRIFINKEDLTIVY